MGIPNRALAVAEAGEITSAEIEEKMKIEMLLWAK